MVRVQVNGKRRKRRKRRRKRKRRKKRKRKRRNRVTIEGGLFPFVDGSFLDMAAGMVYNFVHFYLLLNFYFFQIFSISILVKYTNIQINWIFKKLFNLIDNNICRLTVHYFF